MRINVNSSFKLFFWMTPVALVLASCISGNEEHYDLDDLALNQREAPRTVSDRCLYIYDSLRVSEKEHICLDEECASQFTICIVPIVHENTYLSCQDSLDNDGDDLIDCQDPGCANISYCLPIGENTFAKCTDSLDNDDDGLIDCKDPDCSHIQPCLAVIVPPDPTENTFLECTDSLDNDMDGSIDCQDKGCQDFEICKPKLENTFLLCSDSLDNDKDSKTDCFDEDCQHFDVCKPKTENTFELCSDGIDNDNDSDTDCFDSECMMMEHCMKIEPLRENSNEECSDEIDNDEDGLTDCFDDGCKEVQACLNIQTITLIDVTSTTPDTDLDAAVNDVISGVQWYEGDASSDTPIASPQVTISGSWGGLYLATGTSGDDRETIDLSEYFLKKLRFDVRTSCDGEDLNLKTQWKSPNPDDQVGNAYNFSKNMAKLIPEDQHWEVGDGQWHSYEIDFATAVGLNMDNAKELVLPFSLWCVEANGANIEVQNLRFEGQADIECIEVLGVKDKEGSIFCNVNTQHTLLLKCL